MREALPGDDADTAGVASSRSSHKERVIFADDDDTAGLPSNNKRAIFFSRSDTKEFWQRRCCPKPIEKEAFPLYLCLAALILTHAGSWSCTYFEGAEISITGGHYGLVRPLVVCMFVCRTVVIVVSI
jgi:hypothetical protein